MLGAGPPEGGRLCGRHGGHPDQPGQRRACYPGARTQPARPRPCRAGQPYQSAQGLLHGQGILSGHAGRRGQPATTQVVASAIAAALRDKTGQCMSDGARGLSSPIPAGNISAPCPLLLHRLVRDSALLGLIARPTAHPASHAQPTAPPPGPPQQPLPALLLPQPSQPQSPPAAATLAP